MARKAATKPTTTPNIGHNSGVDSLETMLPELESLDFSLGKDLREMAKAMKRPQAINLIQLYYRLQDQRIRAGGQSYALEKSEEPSAVVNWVHTNMMDLEKRIAKLIDYYSAEHEVAQWARGQKGIGPVFSSAMLAMIDPVKCVTAGDLWAYAGLVPGMRRKAGQKSNWNPQLKVLAWKIGKSFVKVSGKDDAFYGIIYKDRKAYEMAKNEKGEYAETAAGYLKGRDYSKDTEAAKTLKSGKLPPFLIQARSERYAAKLFMAHFLEVYRNHEGLEVVAPWAIAHGGHAHYIAPPNWVMRAVKKSA